MNKQQARRIALGIVSSSIRMGSMFPGMYENLSSEEAEKIEEAGENLASELLRRAGIEPAGTVDDIVEQVIGNQDK